MAKATSARIPLPPQEFLNRVLRYEPGTGKLFWKARSPDLFEDGGHSAAHSCAKWNARFAEKEAFTATKSDGYKHGTVRGVHYPAQRIIWKMVTGIDPDHADHINGVRSDNRLVNLRNVSASENSRNSARHRDNRSGAVGVRWVARTAKWQAFVQLSSGFIHLGIFSDFDDAVAARKAAEANYNFHPNHGRSPNIRR